MTNNDPKHAADRPASLEGGGGSAHRVSAPANRTADGPETDTLRRLDLRDFLAATLRVFAEDDGIGTVLAGPFPVRTNDEEFTPDIIFVAAEHADRLTPTCVNGSVDLAVHIIAPERWSSVRETLERAGVREYWLITPDGDNVDLHALTGNGAYVPLPVEQSGIFRSAALPLLWMRSEWLSARPLPLIRSVLIEWGLPRLFAD